MIFGNFLKIFKNIYGLIGFVLGALIIGLPYYFITWRDSHSMRMGMGDEYYFFIIGLDIVITILFGIFVGATLYKIKYFGGVKKTSKLGVIGGFIGTLVGGCASCSITLATYLGLAGLMSLFPYGGLELKVISIFLLVYACYTTLKNLEVCNLKLKKS